MIYKYDCGQGTIARELTMWEDFAAVRETETVDHPPSGLLDAFVAARPGRRSGRFYVNEHGIVFLPAVEELDAAVFVGRIDPDRDAWFPKHEMPLEGEVWRDTASRSPVRTANTT